MRFYEYDNDFFLVGWHEDPSRPNSTTVPPDGIPPRRARWARSAWVEDSSREGADVAAEQTARTRLQQARDVLRAYDPATATAADVRVALAAVILVLSR